MKFTPISKFLSTSTTFDGIIINNDPNEDPDISRLLNNNKKWVENCKSNDPNFFDRVGGKQRPQYL